MTTCFENGAQVKTSMFGYESAIGVSTLMGTSKVSTVYSCNSQATDMPTAQGGTG